MKINASELTGPALDWAVAKAEGLAVSEIATKWRNEHVPHAYSTDPALAYPIIDREKIGTLYDMLWVYDPEDPDDDGCRWLANDGSLSCYGPTPLVAAMRYHVANKLGETIDIPDWLIRTATPDAPLTTQQAYIVDDYGNMIPV